MPMPIYREDREPTASESSLQSFQVLFRALYPEVFRHLLYLLKSKELAEDLAQESFLRLYRYGWQKVEQPRAWLTTVASRLAYDHFRGEKSSRRGLSLKQREMDHGAAPSAEEEAVVRERVRYWRSLLEQLPERDRLVLLLRQQGKRYSEIAEVLEVEETYVGVILARARNRLRRLHEQREKEGGTV